MRKRALNHPRIVAGVWFALAALVSVILILLFFKTLFGSSGQQWGVKALAISPMVWVPVVVAGLTGALVGKGILSSSAFSAVKRGVAISFISYLVCMAILVIFAGVSGDASNFFRNDLSGYFILTLYGLIYAGWIILPVGGLVGWLLYRLSES